MKRRFRRTRWWLCKRRRSRWLPARARMRSHCRWWNRRRDPFSDRCPACPADSVRCCWSSRCSCWIGDGRPRMSSRSGDRWGKRWRSGSVCSTRTLCSWTATRVCSCHEEWTCLSYSTCRTDPARRALDRWYSTSKRYGWVVCF